MDRNTLGQSAAKKHGKLSIFSSYFPGAGKHCRMLQAGEQAQRSGTDVVIGTLSCSLWPESGTAASRFETLPSKKMQKDGRTVEELDLDACLKRHPDLILIDELSHLNAEEARHMRRYQDIEELLKAGINVYTTLDISHIESIQEAVSSVTGTSVPDRIPDRIFDHAAQVEFIDIEPEQLQQRLLRQNGGELLAGYTVVQLSALREIGLRRCADRAARSAQTVHSKAMYRTHDHILVCLSPSPSNEKIIRTAARMAGAFRCSFTALFVETKAFQWMAQEDKARLQANLHLAQQLGASIETVYGDDVADQIAEFSRLAGVTKIVLGRSGVHHSPFRKTALTDRLIELTPELDIHIIPDSGTAARHWDPSPPPAISILDLLKSAMILVLATLIGFLFYHWGFTEANIITLYILGVMLISVSTKSSVCSMISSIAGVLTFNFFFTVPRFSLHAYDSGYPVTFLVMFLASLMTGSLASKLKLHAKRSAELAWRTKLLFETDQNLQKASSPKEIRSVTAKQLLKILQRDIIVYPIENNKLLAPEIFLTDSGTTSTARYTTPKEMDVAQWVVTNNKRAGAGTETLSDACCIYLSIRTGDLVYGVMGIAAADSPLDSFETSILLSVLGECALALENQKNLEEKEAAAVLAKNEQLRANLLRSISHDLRTPLTSISGNASNLLSNGNLFDTKTKEQMCMDIYDDAMWLIDLVENLLSVSRLEDGRMNLHISTELIDEVVVEALRHVDRRCAQYNLRVQNSEEYLLAQIDAKLIVQVLINLINNAIKYTPPGTEIDIAWERRGGWLQVSVSDTGPGVSDQAKPHIFDMFYSASDPIADSRRSMGLGLALCKSIINAHGGEIAVADRSPHGAIFTFSVPAGEVELHE